MKIINRIVLDSDDDDDDDVDNGDDDDDNMLVFHSYPGSTTSLNN